MQKKKYILKITATAVVLFLMFIQNYIPNIITATLVGISVITYLIFLNKLQISDTSTDDKFNKYKLILNIIGIIIIVVMYILLILNILSSTVFSIIFIVIMISNSLLLIKSDKISKNIKDNQEKKEHLSHQ